ncbi:cytochrome P450 [Xylariomycetidae sp. FL0641]|nr:cytochrome P450 [Xylariomycetidae sp. FL0641]
MDPQATLDIYGSMQNGYETFFKTDLMDFGAGDQGFIWEADPVKRKKVAKKLLPAFGPKAIKAKESTVHRYIDLFVQKMRELGCRGDGVEIGKWTTWFATDLSADLAYNRELKHMENGIFLGTLSQIGKKIPAMKIASLFFVSPSVLRLLPKFFQMNSEEVQRRIDSRGSTRHPDFVDYMLPPDAPPPATKKEKVHLEQVALQLFIAGFDPIQITLNAAFFFLLKEPEAYNLLVSEIRDAFQAYDDINADALAGLKYLHAVIQETLRSHVTTGAGMPRVSPGAMVAGVYVPKGVVCQISNFAIARDPANFRDPLAFRPARWLPAADPRHDPRHARDRLKAFAPFGVGPRMCTGREIAWQQTKLFLAKVLWAFDVEGVRGMDRSFDGDFRLYAMWKRPAVWVRFREVRRG